MTPDDLRIFEAMQLVLPRALTIIAGAVVLVLLAARALELRQRHLEEVQDREREAAWLRAQERHARRIGGDWR